MSIRSGLVPGVNDEWLMSTRRMAVEDGLEGWKRNSRANQISMVCRRHARQLCVT
jgi:hypothetical protein